MTAIRYFLCDQSLQGLHGHCFTYLASIAPVLESQGYEVTLVGHRDTLKSMFDQRIESTFSHLCDERIVPSPIENRRHHEDAIHCDLDSLDRRHRFRASDRLLLNTVHQWPIRGIVRWLGALEPSRRPRIALVLHATTLRMPFEASPTATMYAEAFEAIEQGASGDRIVLFTDTRSLVNEYRALTTLPVHLLPIPHSKRPHPAPNCSSAGAIRIGFLGEARYHKGFHLLPFVAKSIARSMPTESIELHCQAFSLDTDADFFTKTTAYLEKQPNVVLYREPLTHIEYLDLLYGVDVVLLPYTREYYHAQSSGIFADAIGAARTVVVSKGTWMSSELRALGCGLECQSDDYLDLARTTAEACRRLSVFSEKARTAASSWTAFHNPTTYVALLEGELGAK